MTDSRTVVAAAVRSKDGVIHFMPRPHRHHHTVHALHRMMVNEACDGKVIIARDEQGFVLSDGTFANRIEAAKVAIDSGQIAKLNNPPQLYSEDLW